MVASAGGEVAFLSLRPLTRSDGRMATPSSSVPSPPPPPAPLFCRKEEARRACEEEASVEEAEGGIGGGGGGGGGIPPEMPLEGGGAPDDDDDGPGRRQISEFEFSFEKKAAWIVQHERGEKTQRSHSVTAHIS